jgi:hypothetical protein
VRHGVHAARDGSGATVRGARCRGAQREAGGAGCTWRETGPVRPCEARGVGAHSARPREAQGCAARSGSVSSVRMDILIGALAFI